MNKKNEWNKFTKLMFDNFFKKPVKKPTEAEKRRLIWEHKNRREGYPHEK